jgi:hypothetical protein
MGTSRIMPISLAKTPMVFSKQMLKEQESSIGTKKGLIFSSRSSF